jgi:hypothetical protein
MTLIPAGQLHPGHVWLEHDWRLHVTAVDVGALGVAVATTEFNFLLHPAVDELVAVIDEVAS